MTTLEEPTSSRPSSPRSAATAAAGRPSSTRAGAGSATRTATTYLDFFAGAGSLNYGHNNPVLKRALIDYLERDGITHGLDMSTTAKRAFLETFQRHRSCEPRDLPTRCMFPGPTGTNAVEAALKLARKVKGRESIVSFTNAFHGMSLGSLAVTGNAIKRAGAGIPLVHGTPMPFDNYFDGRSPGLPLVRAAAGGPGLRPQPARRRDRRDRAGRGRHQRRPRRVAARASPTCAQRRDMLLIVDDIQMGCGRTGAVLLLRGGRHHARTSSRCRSPSAATACRWR